MIVLFFLSALFAEIVGTLAGFGSSTVFLPLALLFFDFRTALTLVAFFHIFGNATRIGFFRRGLDRKLLVKFGIPSAVFSVIGALLVAHIAQDALKAALGLFLIAYAALFLRREKLAFKATTASAVVGGSLSGFLAGLIGTGGALRGAFLTAFGLPKEKYIALAAATALIVDATRIPVYLQQGFLQHEYLRYLPVLLVVAIGGSFTGKRIVDRIPQRKFRLFVLAVLFLIGVKFVYDFYSK